MSELEKATARAGYSRLIAQAWELERRARLNGDADIAAQALAIAEEYQARLAALGPGPRLERGRA